MFDFYLIKRVKAIANFYPIRSVLYVPASKPRAIEKAKGLEADVIIFDLEDSVAPEQKHHARTAMAVAIKTGGFNAPIVVRINGLESPWAKADLDAIAATNTSVSAILVPKIETRQNISDIHSLMFLTRQAPQTKLWAMVETPKAFFNLHDLCAHASRLETLVFGGNDLAHALELPTQGMDNTGMMGAIETLVRGAKAHGLNVVDGVYNNIKDKDGFLHQCNKAAAQGFDGKSLIHPDQIAGANFAFSPSDAQISHAKTIVKAFENAQKKGLGVVNHEGVMIEALHYAGAQKILAKGLNKQK